MGDLESTFQDKIKNQIALPPVDIMFAPQHLDYYYGYNTITQNSAGDIVLDCSDDSVHVYVSNNEYSVDHLEYNFMPDEYGATYIGTMRVKAAKSNAVGA